MANPTPEQRKAWRLANKESIAAYMKEWRAENKQHLTEYAAAYRLDNPAYKAWQQRYSKEYYKDVIKASGEQLARRTAYRIAHDLAHPDKLKARQDRYKESHRAELLTKAKAAYWAKTEEERKLLSAARVEYQRQWRDAHASELREYRQAYFKENRERHAEQKKAYYVANRAKLLEQEKQRAENRTDAERDKINARTAAWKKGNLEQIAKSLAQTHIRRTRLKGSGGRYTIEDIAAIRKAQNGKCAGFQDARCEASSKNGFAVDHVMPVALGGSSDPGNLQLLCKSCNCRKSRMHPDKWAARLGKLFT